MANKYGNFSEPSYISIGDPYMKKNVEHSRLKGLNFKSTLQKTGANNDAMFDAFRPLYEGEKYTKTITERAEARETTKKQMASDHPFKPPSPQKRSSGLGNYYGCIGNKQGHFQEFDNKPKQKGDYEVGPRNIVTNPPKKGTFGMNKTTLGEKQGVAGSSGEYTYVPHPYDAERKLERELAAKSVEARVVDKPFKPPSPSKFGSAGVPGLTMNGKGPGICGEYAYIENGPTKKEKVEAFEKPFKPSNPPKLGYNSTINKFPHYTEDPLEVKMKAEREARMAEQARMNAQPRFIPPNISRTGATTSVLRKNLA
mmetsp:Transcript_32253/g.39039  ORF Transcript_32253/g.39039 Transcript_32253/m.39039 type:complete len:312 (-) Transcript_32253:358-1293(-)|eukprot:CAMPEP_0197850372 /NCGR_PEP_ID=MMETSP1438-20131217/15224_1 /TAXON_ID=1461541 /ORGANISM="Pterosperma sp., Strain CCMP1384" /LENGTH=311 /DNA_ID=CAMNT_0043463521 /DNA_START=343 /DNA_END=1278 /DNA_ORIENTATION=+